MSTLQRLTHQGLVKPPRWLPGNVQYETIMGSVAYGVSSDTSDVDVYGWAIPPKDDLFPHLRGEMLGFGTPKPRFEQFQEHHVQDQDALAGRGRTYDYSQLHKLSIKTPQGKRAELVEKHGYDVKFAYHVVRLLTEVEMILMEEDLDIQRNNEQLKAIRRGEWTEDRLRQWCADKESHLERVYAESKLRATPDEPKIRALLLTALEEHYGSLEGCVVNPDRAVEALRNIQAELERVRDLL